jgi:hypothetical protein
MHSSFYAVYFTLDGTTNSMPNVVCPACASEFTPSSPWRNVLNDSRVKCPRCDFEFPSNAVRFLAASSKRAALWLLSLLVLGLVLFVVVYLYMGLFGRLLGTVATS